MSAFPLSPLNDKPILFKKLQEINEETGQKQALTTGTATAFLATSNAPDAEPADVTLSVDALHVSSGNWLAVFDASILTVDLLDDLFNVEGVTPYCIFTHSSGIRVYVELEYIRARAATV